MAFTKFKFVLLVLVCLFFQLEAAEKESTPLPDAIINKFHICTVASKMTQGFQWLLNSCSEQGIEIDVLGMNLPYKANGQKLKYIKDYVESLPDDHIVLFVDAFDVLILADKSTILRKFFAFDAPFVIATEKNCWPNKTDIMRYPYCPTPFKYINSGGYIGYAGFIKNMLGNMKIKNTSDQAQLIKYYLSNNFPFALDWYSEIFLCFFLVNESEIRIDERSKSIYCHTTNSTPCILHYNAHSAPNIHQKMAELFLP